MIGTTQLVKCLSKFGHRYAKTLGEFLLIQHGNRFPLPAPSTV